MGKDPAILFYTGDFLTGTSFFNDEQRGKYIKLLCEQHQNGHIPEEHMIEICKTYDSPVMKKFIKDSAGMYFNERMEEEAIRRKTYSESRRNNRIGSQKEEEEKQTYDKSHDKTYDSVMTEHMETGTDTINVIDNDIEDLYKNVVIFFDENCKPKTEASKKEWCDTLDKLIRIDGHTSEHIQNIIKRTRMDDFWRTNFLSVLKLRKKNKEGILYFTVFENKMIKKNGQNRIHTADEYAADRIG